MQKLEEILHAEDLARHAVAEAREQAQTILRDAAAEADLVTTSAKRKAAEKARKLHEKTLAAAEKDARAIESEAEAERSALVSRAEQRLPQAIDALVRELTG